jgi:hypothetical protein
MFTGADIVYYLFYILCLIFSFFRTNAIKGIKLLRAVLVLGLLNEFYVEVRQYMGKEENFSHFLYIPLEYCLLTLFYCQQTKKKYLRYAMLISIPIYLCLAYYFAFTFYNFRSYPSIVYNIGCVFSIIWLTLIMFTVEMIENISIVKIPVFWLTSGLLVFYAGVYFFNTAYSYLLVSNQLVASEIRTYINLGLNIILYTFWTYAFICSAKIKNYTYH